MQARLTMKPEHEVIAAIHALDLESVKMRVMDAELGEGWSREYADSIEAAYKTYLTMLVKYPGDAEDIMLAEDVDEFWHTHILQTMKYAQDCQAVFGNFLHHEPHVGERTAADVEKRAAMAERTRQIYAKEFGEARDVAWSGHVTKDARGAYSAASIPPQAAAYSAASIKVGHAAYSAASIRPQNAAYSAASIKADHAAYSAASIRPQNAAYSAASIKADHAAYSAASIRPQHAAYSAASIKADHAAYSAASIRPENAAYSAAAMPVQNHARTGSAGFMTA